MLVMYLFLFSRYVFVHLNLSYTQRGILKFSSSNEFLFLLIVSIICFIQCSCCVSVYIFITAVSSLQIAPIFTVLYGFQFSLYTLQRLPFQHYNIPLSSMHLKLNSNFSDDEIKVLYFFNNFHLALYFNFQNNEKIMLNFKKEIHSFILYRVQYYLVT